MLKLRIFTALVLIPLTVLALIYLPAKEFCYVTGIIALAAAWEWTHLMQMTHPVWRLLYLCLMAGIFFMTLFIPIPLILWSAMLWWLLATLLVICYPYLSRYWGHFRIWRGIMGIAVLMPCWITINYIRNQPSGLYALLMLFILIWGADTAAYFVGKKWGKHKLAPKVSPGKSIEGFLGALLFGVLISLAAAQLFQIPFALWGWCLLLATVTVLASVIGDLFESMIKRYANLKDSGRLLPGHGGLLDRIDSLTAAAPVFACGAWVLSHYLA